MASLRFASHRRRVWVAWWLCVVAPCARGLSSHLSRESTFVAPTHPPNQPSQRPPGRLVQGLVREAPGAAVDGQRALGPHVPVHLQPGLAGRSVAGSVPSPVLAHGHKQLAEPPGLPVP